MNEHNRSIETLLARIAVSLEAIADQKKLDDKTEDVSPVIYSKPDSRDYFECRDWAVRNGVPGKRAAHAIGRAGIRTFGEVRYDRLQRIKNCGEVTIELLLDWADSRST